MLNHPALLLAVATQQHQELIEQASAFRLAAAVRRARRQHWPDDPSAGGRHTGRHRDTRPADVRADDVPADDVRADDVRRRDVRSLNEKSGRELSAPVGRLNTCEVAGQAR